MSHFSNHPRFGEHENNPNPFRKDLYDDFDTLGKQAVREFLEGKGWTVQSDETFGVDLIAMKLALSQGTVETPDDCRICLHEVEVRPKWIGAWPYWYTKVNLPLRKMRLIADEIVWFWVVSADCRKAWLIHSDDLTTEMIEEVPNEFVPEGEKFFRVPFGLCRKIFLKEKFDD